MSIHNIHTTSDLNEFVEKHDVALVYLSKENCSVCHALWPKVEEQLIHYPFISTAYVHLNDAEAVPSQYEVFTVPTILIFVKGREWYRASRFIRMEELQRQFEQLKKA
ncbi:thioredoxin family protein [Bacillus sp. Marseille-P3800]|uniref:thioredoxin family protein n=1 Tax=Bacillus sp. Marseille-P3800 TaxID=2014782 RepID=UPI00159BE949|nr:thioredoxin family protein [Bacillus sp. Marseille-P3800]